MSKWVAAATSYSIFGVNSACAIDMTDALHPQTILAYGMNGADLPIGHGGPLRLWIPRQLGYKSVKFITRMHLTDSLEKFRKGSSYSWYAGI